MCCDASAEKGRHVLTSWTLYSSEGANKPIHIYINKYINELTSGNDTYYGEK